MTTVRTPNFFERVLLVIGVLVIIAGYAVIHKAVAIFGVGIEAVGVIFMWLILIAIIIQLAVSENMKEELKIVVENQLEEIKLLRKEMEHHRK